MNFWEENWEFIDVCTHFVLMRKVMNHNDLVYFVLIDVLIRVK
jgi:hypothetical protein